MSEPHTIVAINRKPREKGQPTCNNQQHIENVIFAVFTSPYWTVQTLSKSPY